VHTLAQRTDDLPRNQARRSSHLPRVYRRESAAARVFESRMKGQARYNITTASFPFVATSLPESRFDRKELSSGN